MAELKKKEDELTTADLAGMGTNSPENKLPPQREIRPELVRNEPLRRDEAASTFDAERNPVAMKDDLVDEAGNERAEAEATRLSTPPRGTDVGGINSPAALFAESDVADFRARWSNIQTAFVDEPRGAVENADNLVASLMKKLAEGFAHERENLEKQWDRGDNVSTEDLRVALQRYRSFFDRLLKV